MNKSFVGFIYALALAAPALAGDVGVARLIAPQGTVDSGTVLTPSAVVCNYGDTIETFQTRMKVGSRYAAISTSELQPGDSAEVSFAPCTLFERGHLTVKCSTMLFGDDVPANDMRQETLQCRVRDVGARGVLSPGDTVVLNAPFYPRAVYHNYGTTSESLSCNFDIDGTYHQTLPLVLPSGAETSVVFSRDSTVEGLHEARAYTVLGGDMARHDDTAAKAFRCCRHDVGTAGVISPPDTVYFGTQAACASKVKNYGGFTEQFYANFTVWNTTNDALIYKESSLVTLAPSDSAEAGMARTWLVPTTPPEAYYEVRAYTGLPNDQIRQGSDTAYARIHAIPPIPVQHDIGVAAILRPSGNMLLGDTATPRAVVRNYGLVGEEFRVKFRIGPAWSDSVYDSLDAGRIDTVRFDLWTAVSAGRFAVKCSTALARDQVHTNDTLGGSVRVWQPRTVTGSVLDSNSSSPIRARLDVSYLGSTTPYFRTTTDSLGRFTFPAIDTGVVVQIHPDIPYPDRLASMSIHGDTSLHVAIPVANLLLVDNDYRAMYESFYTSTFDSLQLRYCIRSGGTRSIQPELLNRLSDRLVVWYTGQTGSGLLTPDDTACLGQFLDAGGRLFISGQNIAQALDSSPFLLNRLHARLVNPRVTNIYVYPVRDDPVGMRFAGARTLGNGGANNQNSRDEIAADDSGHAFLLYDTLTRQVAGVYCCDSASGSRVIYLAFGFEAVDRPLNHPDFMTRPDFFWRCYAWLTGIAGIDDFRLKDAGCIAGIRVSPTVSRGPVTFLLSGHSPRDRRTQPFACVGIFDASGREVRRLSFPPASNSEPQYLLWDGRDRSGRLVPAGVYVYRLQSGHSLETGALRLVR